MIGTAELTMAEIEGGLHASLDDARPVLALATSGADPIAHTGMLSIYSALLIMSGRYEEGLRSSEHLALEAENYGLEFPVPFAKFYSASALIGLRRFAAGARILSALERSVQADPGSFIRGGLPVQRARAYASVGDLERATDVLSLGPPESLVSAVLGEFIGWRAVFTAINGDCRVAKGLVDDARRVSHDAATQALSCLAEAIIALEGGVYDTAVARLRTTIATGVLDPLVIAIRAAPHLGAFIADQPEWRSWLQRLLAGSRDASLAASLGLRIPRAAKTRATLTPRENEVHELLAQGLTNDEIAKLLHISLSTTKVHVKHIYEKLGVRSRLEAARALRDDV
jgi:DNA-binding NarL/FixJ family response regulator